MSQQTDAEQSGVSRRTLVKGAVWAVPAVAVAATVPLAAASPIPGINGWVNNTFDECKATQWAVTSNPSGAGCPTPDNYGCTWGLYTLGVSSASDVASATIIEYVKAKDQATTAGWTWTTTGNCWVGGTAGANVQLLGSSGGWWTPYTWTYHPNNSGCALTLNCALSCNCNPPQPYFCFANFNATATRSSGASVDAYTQRTIVLKNGTQLQFMREIKSCKQQVAQPKTEQQGASTDGSSSSNDANQIISVAS